MYAHTVMYVYVSIYLKIHVFILLYIKKIHRDTDIHTHSVFLNVALLLCSC